MSKAAKKSILFALAALVLIGFAMWVRWASRSILHHVGWVYLRSGIYLFLFSAWGFSIHLRIVQTQVRRYLLGISGLMVLWLLLRSIKYAVNPGAFYRYLWYGYQLPMLFIPTLSVLLVMSLGHAENYRPPRWTRAMYFLAGGLLLLVLTNDLHQWVFTFPNGVMSDLDYGYGAGYYFELAWELLCAAWAMALILIKCRLPHSRVYLSLPLIPFAFSVAYVYAYVTKIQWVWVLAGDLTVAQCLMFAGIFESCIQCGLIQSNLGYDELLEATTLPVQITDGDFSTKHISAAMEHPLLHSQLRQITENTMRLDSNTLLKHHPLRHGYAFWKEDISELNQLEEELEQTRDELRDIGDLLAAENAQQARLLQLTEKNRLYDMMETQTAPQIAMLQERLTELKKTKDPDSARRLLGQITIIGTYIKRRNNLIFVGVQRGAISMQELRLCLNESAENLNLYGVPCKVIVTGEGIFTMEQGAQIYDLFEAVVEAGLESMSSLLMSIEIGKQVDVNLCVSAAASLCGLTDQFPGLQWERDEDGLQYLTQKLERPGGG